MQNSKYNPLQNSDMTKQNLNFDGYGKHALNLTAGQTHNIDYKLLDDKLLTGASVLVKNANFGDKFHLQVVDVDNILGYGAGAVLLQTITDWGVAEDKQDQGSLEVGYPAKVITGLYLRMIYVSTGQVNPSVIINYHLHKVLC
jgi:hypothetical protein